MMGVLFSSLLLILTTEQDPFQYSMALHSEHEASDDLTDMENVDQEEYGAIQTELARMLKRGGGSKSSSKSGSTRGSVRLYFGSGRRNSGGRCYDNDGEVTCEENSSIVGIVIGSIVGLICLFIIGCYIMKNCNCCKKKKDQRVAHYKNKDKAQAEVDKIMEVGVMKK